MAARHVELTTHMNAVQRSQGDSATARAAYRAGCLIECEREGKIHDYRRKRGVDAVEITVPKRSPLWAKDAAKLWNAVEQREKNGKRGANANQFRANAQTARDYMFGYPAEMSEVGRRIVARIVAGHLVSTSQVAVMHAIHAPGKDGDERNWHCHMMFTTRRMTPKGLAEKTREWDERDREGSGEPNMAKQLRAFVAKTINEQLAAEGKAHLVHVEHESFKARGVAQKPQTHQGPARMHGQRKQRVKDRKAWFQQHQTEQCARQGKELASVRVRQDFGLQSKLADLAHRQRTGEAEIQRRLDERRAADRAPTGARLAFLAITGRAGREAFDRQARDGQRTQEAAQEVAALKKDVQQERNLYVAGQVQERAALIERHGAEDRQLQQAFVSRESLDQSADRALQREQRNERGWQQEQDRQRLEQTRPRGRTRGPGFEP